MMSSASAENNTLPINGLCIFVHIFCIYCVQLSFLNSFLKLFFKISFLHYLYFTICPQSHIYAQEFLFQHWEGDVVRHVTLF